MESTLLTSGRKSEFNCCSPEEKDGLHIIIFCFGILCICVTIALVISIVLGDPEFAARGRVSTSDKHCSQAGLEILQKGGNSVDAAIAAIFCMCVVNPHITSIGGGGVLLIQDQRSSKPPVVINFQPSAPSSPNFPDLKTIGAQTVGVPGFLSGLWETHQKYGQTKWSDLLETAIHLSENGVDVSKQLADAVGQLAGDSPLKNSELFFPDNNPLAEGRTLKQPKLARLFKSIAQNGISDFYRGDQSKNLIRFMKENGVEWNATAVETYKANAENPIMGVYKNMNLYTSGAPTSGPQLIAMLNILRGFQSNPRDQFTLSHIHQVIETMRVTQSQLAGDPQFDNRVNEIVSQMLSPTFADQVRKQITDDSIFGNASFPELPTPVASVVAVTDNDDLSLSLVSGLNSQFGSQLMHPDDGYLLNNAMANFFANITFANVWEGPGQKSLQLPIPVIAADASNRCGLRFVTGASDPSHLGQVLFHLLEWNQTAAEVIRNTRMHTEAQSNTIKIEEKFPEQLINKLDDMGYQAIINHTPFPPISIIMKRGDVLTAQADSRDGSWIANYGP